MIAVKETYAEWFKKREFTIVGVSYAFASASMPCLIQPSLTFK